LDKKALAGLVVFLLLLIATPADAQWRHHRNRGFDPGAAIFGGIVGGIAGGVIGGMIGPPPVYYRPPPPPVYYQPPVMYQPQYVPQQQYVDPQIAYCIQRFRSYNPQTQSYMGYDGFAHRCP
jgi:hypothetical protein